MSQREDAELLAAWGEGDPRAGSRLFNRYFVPVSRFFANKIHGDHDDLIQETFASCLRGRDHLRDKSSFRAYVFAIASNVLRMYFRRTRASDPALDLAECSARDLAAGPSTMLRAREEERVLLDALRELPLELQIVMELYYWESMRTHEIAEVVDLPTGTVRSHLRRSRLLLAKSLRRAALGRDLGHGDGAELDHWATSVRDTVTRCCA